MMEKRSRFNTRFFKWIIWVTTILIMGVIYYFSSQPAEVSRQLSGEVLVTMDKIETEEIHNISDRRVWDLHYYIRKFAHFILYFGLGFMACLSVVLIKYKSYWSYLLAWLIASVYGIFDELHQNLVPGRGATLDDMKLDSVSALVGVIVAIFFIEIFRRSRRCKLW